MVGGQPGAILAGGLGVLRHSARPPVRPRRCRRCSPIRPCPVRAGFPASRLNYVDQVLRHCDRDPVPAIIGIDEDGTRTEIDWPELPGRVGAVAAELRRLGVGAGRRRGRLSARYRRGGRGLPGDRGRRRGVVGLRAGLRPAGRGGATGSARSEGRCSAATATGSTAAGSTSVRTPPNCSRCCPAIRT